MAYMHIENLYKAQDILAFKECYAMEKIHGTSARISFKAGRISFFAGGINQGDFLKLFNEEDLKTKFSTIVLDNTSCTVYGEAHGGKIQSMSKMYGPKLKFVCFEVKIGDSWLDVPNAEDVVKKLGLEFVHYDKVGTDIDTLNKYREANSVQAVRNGMGEGHVREGIVLRPLIEVKKNNGERIIAKYKADWASEIKTTRKVNNDQLAIIKEAKQITEEWVTQERFSHILGRGEVEEDLSSTGKIIAMMIEDVEREAKGEIVMSAEVKRNIGRATALLFKAHLNSKLK